jgi:HPt (histidine-containing phosphotransfer) domain-containing protein
VKGDAMSQDPMDARLAMLRRVGGDRLIRDLIDLLFENAPRKLAAARAALAEGDADGVGRVAHALASSAGNLGAADMQQAAYALERDAADGKDLAESLRRLEASWEGARDLLAEKKRGLNL